MPMDKMITNLADYGNTTSVDSTPLALDEAAQGVKVKPCDVIACAGFWFLGFHGVPPFSSGVKDEAIKRLV